MAISKESEPKKNSVKMGAQTVNDLVVKYSHLAKPDLEYNSGHSVTVIVNDELKKLHKQLTAQTGVKLINGLKNDDGTELAKFGTKIHVNDGIERFPNLYDIDGQKTMEIPFGGDKINVVFKPKEWDVSNKKSISCYLQEIQVVEKSTDSSVTFAKPQKKSTEVTFNAESNEENLPF